MSGQIFISYRREESHWLARSLNERLSHVFGPNQIFMDIDSIALGEDFVKVIETTVAKCDTLIAVIGNNWLTSKDDQGARRLDNPEDFVRTEIATALKREIRVIPVLVDGASMPRLTELPDDLKSLIRRNALRISDTSFDGDCQRLVAAIKEVLEKAATEEQEREKNRLDAVHREREEKQRREADSAEVQRREDERLLNERRDKDRLDAEGLEAERRRRLEALEQAREERERLEAEQRQREEKERLQAEQRQRDGTSNGKTDPPSPALSQDSGPAQAEIPPIVQSQGSAMRKPFALRAPVVVVVLLLIVGAIWFAGSKLNHIDREAASATPTPTPTPSLVSSDPAFYNKRGLDFYHNLDYDKAISDYTDAIRLNPNYAKAYYNRGKVYYYRLERDKAISDYTDAIRLNPNDADAYNARGDAYYDKNEYDKAISDYTDAIRLNPKSAKAYCNRGIVYYYKREYDKAISDYTDAIRLNPNDGHAYYARGMVYQWLGNDAQAQVDFDRAAKLGYRPNFRFQ